MLVVLLRACAFFCSAQAHNVIWQMSPSHTGTWSQSVESNVVEQEVDQFAFTYPESEDTWQQVPTASAPLDQCEVSEESRVGCGEPGISPADCEALNCCFDKRRFIRAYDGPMCYYGKSGED